MRVTFSNDVLERLMKKYSEHPEDCTKKQVIWVTIVVSTIYFLKTPILMYKNRSNIFEGVREVIKDLLTLLILLSVVGVILMRIWQIYDAAKYSVEYWEDHFNEDNE